jgi:hypothetical protein
MSSLLMLFSLPAQGKGREGKGREGKGREGKGREGMMMHNNNLRWMVPKITRWRISLQTFNFLIRHINFSFFNIYKC